jgi:hypothetical protein
MPGSGAMEGGDAYNRHATIPAQGAAFALPYLEAAARAVSFDRENDPVVIADYGSSEGRNSLAPMRIAIDVFRSRFGRGRPIVVCHTDLPVNDFKSLFALLENDPERYLLNDKCVFPCVIGRSFYQSVLPPAYVHLGWSSYAAMWISQILPVRPDHIFVPRMTGAARFELERQVAQTFLTLRAAELRSGEASSLCFRRRATMDPRVSRRSWIMPTMYSERWSGMARSATMKAAGWPLAFGHDDGAIFLRRFRRTNGTASRPSNLARPRNSWIPLGRDMNWAETRRPWRSGMPPSTARSSRRA